jgi:hypothetical protein
MLLNSKKIQFNNYMGSTKNNGWSYSTGEALSTNIFTIFPDTSDSISLNNFIAYMMQTTLPVPISSPTFTNEGLSGDDER